MFGVTEAEFIAKYQRRFHCIQTVGCGENWPISELGVDDLELQANRRVDVFLYDSSTVFPNVTCFNGQCNVNNCQIYRSVAKDGYVLKEFDYVRTQKHFLTRKKQN